MMCKANWLLGAFFLGLLGGCASLDNKAVSDEVLARKAAVALNVADTDVTISNRSAEAVLNSSTLHFTATTKQGSSHRCYIGAAFLGLVKSEAVCSGTASCNALLKSAGKCN